MCGIFGIINKEKTEFDYQTFVTLGINNDTRGGDSCGVFIDGKCEYGVKDKKFFEDFFMESKVLESTYKSRIALGHCRKASVGAINETTAQPVVLRNKAGMVKYVLLHNGTIYNYEELAAKYIPNVDIKGMTDSQVMARIFYYKGYDVLGEYEGGSVFFMVDYRQPEPEVLMFKGASKKYSTDTTITEERPLYITLNTKEGELIFSSIDTYMYAARREQTIYSVVPNKLIRFDWNSKDLNFIDVFDRKDRCQSKKYKSTVYDYSYTGYYNTGITSSYGPYIRYDSIKNLYMNGNKIVNGKTKLTKYGRVIPETSKDNYEVREIWFLNGVAMDSKESYDRFIKLEKIFKDGKENFMKLYQNDIRYHSLDKVYLRGKEMVKAIKPNKYELFSGTLQTLAQTSLSHFKNGKFESITYGGDYENSFKKIN